MKLISSALLVISILCSFCPHAPALEKQTGLAHFQSSYIIFEGVDVGFLDSEGRERCALSYNDIEYIPLATVGLWMGADTLWNRDTETVTIISNGKNPVFHSLDELHYEMCVTRPKNEEWYDGKDGIEVQILSSAIVTVDGDIKSFSDAQGRPIYPILFLNCIYLPLRNIAELMGKQVQEFYPRVDESPNYYYLNIYQAPTQEELKEADAYFAAVREHLNAIRKLCETSEVRTDEDFTNNVRKIQSDLKAIQALPLPAFQGVNWYIDRLLRSVTLNLAAVDFYLPVEESSGARVEVYGTDQRFHTANPDTTPKTPEEKWVSFVSSKIIQSGENAGRANAFFDAAENSCTVCEAYMAAVASGQSIATTSIVNTAMPSSQDIVETLPSNPVSFVDAADIKHWEAVAALAKLGVMDGKDDGAFHPSDILTRAEAAKLSVLILYGGTIPVFEKKSSPAFSDIQGHWAENYIEFCSEYAIVSGRGDRQFDPDGQITGLELAKIALTTLGYEVHEYKLFGDSWADQTDTLARRLTPSLYQGLDGVVLTQPITRDDAAQILYNALYATAKVGVAEYTDDAGQRRCVLVDDTRSDGSPSSLLYRYFGLDDVGDIPDQPDFLLSDLASK